MTYVPKVIAFDYETALLDGTPSVEHYRHDFRAISCAFSWYREDGQIKSAFKSDECEIRKFLQYIVNKGIVLVAHNAQFEMGVTKSRFKMWLPKIHDTMRLVQVRDNGGKKYQEQQVYHSSIEIEEAKLSGKWKMHSGLGLTSACKRLLPGYENHKEKYHKLIVKRGGSKGSEGSRLDLLTKEELMHYNVADTENTLKLYTQVVGDLKKDNYNPALDHRLYLGSVKRIIKSYIKGVKVNLTKLRITIFVLEEEIENIEKAFHKRFEKEIADILEERACMKAMVLKTERGMYDYFERLKGKPLWFNTNSGKQLEELFVGRLGFEIKFRTDKGNPRFGAAFLPNYGEGGRILKGKKTTMLTLSQAKNLRELSRYDGRWHIDLKACGTATGRFAGGRHGH